MGKILLISFLFLIVFSLTPLQTQAAGLVPCGGHEFDADGKIVTRPLTDPVPSGWDKISGSEMAKLEPACTLCHLFVLFNNIIKFAMTTLVPVIAVLMLVIGGVMFFFAGAKPDTLNQAKGIITSVVIGLLIIFSAWIIVNTVLNFSGIVTSPSLLKWYDIGCSI